MLKPSSSNCNLSCKYCFYHSLASRREEYSKGMMTARTAERVIDSALDFANGSGVFFTFQGGEPLLCGVGFFSHFVDYARKNNTKGSKLSFCLQTNATLITDEYARFFADNDFLVGVSLDGDRELNSYRLYPDGRESFDDVIKGIEILKKYNVKFNVLSVLTKRTALDFRRAYRFFKSNSLRYIQFITGIRPENEDYDEDMYMSCEDYAYFLNKCFNIYYNDCMRGEFVSIRSFDNYALLAGGGNAEQCGMNGFCSTQFVVEGDGSVYPCDFYCTDEWYLGNINELSFIELYKAPELAQFLKASFEINDNCKTCDYFYICRSGGCKRARRSADYCKAYKDFFSQAEYKLKQMKRQVV